MPFGSTTTLSILDEAITPDEIITNAPELRFPIPGGCDGVTDCILDAPCEDDHDDLPYDPDAKFHCPHELEHELEHLGAFLASHRPIADTASVQ